MTVIRIENVSKRYEQTRAVQDVSLEVNKSTFTVLLGRSGCGKTTTLRLVAGLEKPDSGDIWIGDQQVSGAQIWIPATQRQIGMVFQDYALFPHMDVAQNVSFGLPNATAAERRSRVADMLDLVGLIGLEDRFPHQLSGGQQQRVALARALAPAPDVILLDEPFSNLDASLRHTMREEVRNILQEAQATTIFVTHDQEEALRLADDLVVMENGHVLQHGPSEDVYRFPANLQVAQFLGEVNILHGAAASGSVETPIGTLPLITSNISGSVEVVVRPEAITVAPDPTGPLVVKAIRYFGFYYLVTLSSNAGDHLVARTWTRDNLSVGDHVKAFVESPVVAFPQEDEIVK